MTHDATVAVLHWEPCTTSVSHKYVEVSCNGTLTEFSNGDWSRGPGLESFLDTTHIPKGLAVCVTSALRATNIPAGGAMSLSTPQIGEQPHGAALRRLERSAAALDITLNNAMNSALKACGVDSGIV